jgi:peptidyl-prolyl cis-trans isomerase B (cyclophilin B)
MAKNPEVTIRMESGKEIKLELYPEQAENTVRNFIDLAEEGYYDGLKFHRVIKGFMIQGGCPDGTGMGGPGYSIKGEFSANGFDNDLSHERGVVSMARSSHPDSAGSQFFIVHQDSPHLDGKYAAFGQVLEGMDVVDQIAEVDTGARDMPQEDQVMDSVEVELFGEEYESAERI